MDDKIIRGDGPTAVESKIGYLLSGPTKKSTNEGGSSMLNILISHKEEEYELEKFWKIELHHRQRITHKRNTWRTEKFEAMDKIRKWTK